MPRHALPFLSAVLVIALLLQSCGELCIFFGIRTVARIEARSLVRASVPTDRCLTFTYDKATKSVSGKLVSWKEDDEFVLAGQMYDVLRRYDSSGVEVIVAVLDGADSWIHAAIDREQDRQARQQTSSGPVRDLLTTIAACKAIQTEKTILQPPCMKSIGHTSQPPQELLSGFRAAVDRPPPMA